MTSEPTHIRLLTTDADAAVPEAPDGVPGPLRLLALLEHLCGGRQFWPAATQREVAGRLAITERTAREWMGVLTAAGVAVWRVGGGRKPSTCYLLQHGEIAVEAVEVVLGSRPIWRGDSSGHASGHPSGHSDSDSADPSGQPATLPVMPPVERPSTVSSSSSSSSRLPEELEAPEQEPDRPFLLFPAADSGLTLPGRLAKMGIEPTDRLVTALVIVPADIREAALLRAYQHNASSPRYVLECLRTVQFLAAANGGQAPRAPAARPAPEPEPEPIVEPAPAPPQRSLEVDESLIDELADRLSASWWTEGDHA